MEEEIIKLEYGEYKIVENDLFVIIGNKSYTKNYVPYFKGYEGTTHPYNPKYYWMMLPISKDCFYNISSDYMENSILLDKQLAEEVIQKHHDSVFKLLIDRTKKLNSL